MSTVRRSGLMELLGRFDRPTRSRCHHTEGGFSFGGSMRIADIRIDGGTQTRETIDPAVVAEYAEALINQAEFPPVAVFHDGSDYWLADGFHRYAAHRAAGFDDITADVLQGTRRDAILHSVGANSAHGLRRTNADKRRAVETMLRDDEWSQWSDREIARRCSVNDKTVGNVRRELSAENPQMQAERKVERNGTVYTQKTENIGAARRVQPEPTITDPPSARPLVDLGGIDPRLYTRATSIGGTIGRCEEITQYDPVESATGFKEHERSRVVDNARKIIGWLNRLVEAMEVV